MGFDDKKSYSFIVEKYFRSVLIVGGGGMVMYLQDNGFVPGDSRIASFQFTALCLCVFVHSEVCYIPVLLFCRLIEIEDEVKPIWVSTLRRA